MFDHRKIPLCFLLATALLFAAGASARGNSIMPENKVPDQVESKARRLMHDLKEKGFEVSRGYFKLWEVDDCDYTAHLMGVCYGNNPAAPYIIMTLPPWPEEFVDVMSNLWGPSVEGYHDTYRFDPREAIVILGQLPPPGAYFSEQTWLFTRQGKYSTDSQRYKDILFSPFWSDFIDLFFAYEPQHPERIQILSSLSNIVNNVVIERQSSEAFDQIRYFIITPDRYMDKAVRKAFAGISVKGEDVFTEQIPSNMFVGLDQSSDDFTTWLRYAHPYDATAGDKWRKDLPLVVLRVRDTRPNRAPKKYPPFFFADLEERKAVDEWPLKDDLGNLLAAVSERWEQPCVTAAECLDRAESFMDMQTSPTFVVGPLCTEVGQNCLLDTQDTAYQLYRPNPFGKDKIYAVAGTLGTKTGNATYVGFGINQASILKGVADLSDEKLDGTASEYETAVKNTDKFYLYYFTWDCTGLGELTGGHCFQLKDYIPLDDSFVISIRDYVVPDTQRGPDSKYVMPSKVLTLDRPPGLK